MTLRRRARRRDANELGRHRGCLQRLAGTTKEGPNWICSIQRLRGKVRAITQSLKPCGFL